MAAGAVSSATVPQHDVRWKWFLLSLSLFFTLWLIASTIDSLGFNSRPWYGWWDSVIISGGQPYVVEAQSVVQGGATEGAGIQNGDRFDLREQTLDGRLVLLGQPITTQSTMLILHRGTRTYATRITGSTIWEGQPYWKLLGTVPILIGGAWFLACALLITLRCWQQSDGRNLALVLLFLVPGFFTNQMIVVPKPWISFLTFAVLQGCALAALLFLMRLSTKFGVRSGMRRLLEIAAYAAISLDILVHAGFYIALFSLRINPLRLTSPTDTGVTPYDVGATLLTAIVCVAAVAHTAPSSRSRCAWLLLPVPIALLVSAAAGYLAGIQNNWLANTTLQTLSMLFVLMSAFLVTYALLKRRIFDFEFVLSRTIAVAILSLLVVAAFVLLEWVLGTVLAGVSHITGLLANAGLALVLGLSMNAIHKRVDTAVDAILFRKRHDDERALLDFSKEAAYVTEPQALLDQAIVKVQLHTDARNATILLHESGSFAAVRSFGESATLPIDENDSAILALKTWHKPLDPHRYDTALRGALALPMLARGRLLGVLLLGERAGGEAYTPDEIEALSQVAQGVGSALDALSLTAPDSAMLSALASMQEAIVSEIRALRTSSPA